MCGIAGYIEFGGPEISKGAPYKIISEMLDTIIHRGPDDYGISIYGYDTNEDIKDKFRVKVNKDFPRRVVLGMRRLAILELSEKGHQPMQSHDGSIEIIFNGEIYNYIELREELKANARFDSGSDTEVLIEAYRQWGIDMLNKLDGMFAFVILDKERQKIICARDPIGIKPFYYHFTKSCFVFGSEPKVVLKGLGVAGSADLISASEFFMIGVTDHEEDTFYSEVKQLPGGCFMDIPFRGDINLRRYWNAPPGLLSEEGDYKKETYENILLSVKRHLRADVTIGTSLSGGIDSGTIVTAAGEILGKDAHTYNTLTFTYPEFKDDESEYAKTIAANSGMKWHPVIPDTGTLSNDLEKMMIGMGEPFSTLSMFAQYKVMQEAHKIGIKVMLDGQGGDEIYLGYPRVAQRVLLENLRGLKMLKFLKEAKGLKKNASLPVIRSLPGNLFFSSPSIPLKRNFRRLENYVNKDILHMYRKAIANDVYSGKNIFEVQLDELTKYCLPRLLKYTDRNSMAFSVESRVPHLSKIMLDYALRLPLNWRVRDGWTKYSVRKAMEGKLPDKILWSNLKKGFPIPQKYWVEKLKGSLEEWLSLDRLNGVIKKDNIIKAINGGKGDEPHLWRAISFGSWVNLMNVKL